MKKWILALAAIGFSANALAVAPSPRADARQANQADRVAAGVASGALTPRETAGLVHQQRHIHAAERHFESDGRLGYHERRALEAMQDGVSHSIYRRKHNRRHR